MVVKHLDTKLLTIIDGLSDQAIKELLEYIRTKRDLNTSTFLNQDHIKKILTEDVKVLEKLAK